MVMWVKKNTADWVDVKKIWVKKNSTSWTAVKKIWVKNTPSVWSQFWPDAGPYPDEDLELAISKATYPSVGTSYPILTAKVYHYFSDGALTLRYKWSAGPTNSGPWTELIGYSTYQTYSPGNPALNSFNTLSITPEIYEYVSGRTYFKFTMQSVDSSGVSTREVVSDPITVDSPVWNVQPSFSGAAATGYTLTWNAGKAYISGVSDNVGYQTTIYRTSDNGVTKQYLYGTATVPDFIYSDNYEYSFSLTTADVGYTYHASTYAVFSDTLGEKANANRSSTISAQKTVAAPPGAFSITSATKGKYALGRPISIVWSTSANATSYEFSIQSSSDQISWTNHVVYGVSGATPPTTSKTYNINTTAPYVRVTMRSTNSSQLYAYTSTVLAVGQAPTAPVITSATSTTTDVVLTFTPPSDNGSSDDIRYWVAYKTTASSTWGNFGLANIINSNQIKFYDILASGTSYDFKIQVQNFDQLYSPDSNIFTISTKVAPGPITNVSAKSFDSGYLTTFFMTGTNTTSMNLDYLWFQTQPVLGDGQNFDLYVSSSSKYATTNTPALLYPDEFYNISLIASNQFGISTDYGLVYQIAPNGSDKPTASIPTFSSVTGTGFEANFTLTGSVNSIIVDVKTGGSSVSGYPKTVAITDTTGGTTYATATVVDLSPATSYVFYVTPKYDNSTYSSFVYNGVQRTATVGTNYAFSMGKSLYVSTNGYIGLTSGSSAFSAIPSTGYNILVHLADFVQRQTTLGDGSAQLFRWSNSTQYSLRWNGYLLGFENNGNYRVTYQINFYTDQQYYDIKYVHVGSNVYGTDSSNIVPGLYINGTLKTAGTTLPFPWFISSGTTYRVYYNGSATTSGVAFTEIAQADMVDVGAVTNGNSDDGFTSITTAVDQYTLPTVSIGTISRTTTTLSIPLTGTYAKYDYNIRTDSHTGTSVKSGTDQTVTPISVTGLTQGTTYYVSVTPKNAYGQTGSVQQTTRSTENAYTITFDSQSGTAVAALTQATAGGSIAKPTDPTRTNYAFNGWFTATTGGTAVIWPRTPTANETLYAQWTYLNLVTFNVNGGGGTAPTDLRQITAGGSITLPGIGSMTAPAGKNTFSGWVTTTTGTTALTGSYTPTADVTLYAYWTEAKSAPTGGSVTISGTVTQGETLTATVVNASGNPTPTFTYQWQRNSGGTSGNQMQDISGATGSTRVLDGFDAGYNVRVKINFSNSEGNIDVFSLQTATTVTPLYWTITYNGNGGSTPTNTSIIRGLAGNVTATVPTWTGRTFAGWNTASDGTGTNYASSALITPTANLTLYAKWTINAVVWGTMPNPAFARSGGNGGSTSTSYRWGWNNQTPSSGLYTGDITWEWQFSSANTTNDQRDNPSGLISSGTRPARSASGLTVGGSTYNNRVSSLSTDYGSGNPTGAGEPVAFSTSPRYLRYRAVVTGLNGSTYRSNYSGWV